MRQGGDPHPRRHHLNQQQCVIHVFQRRANPCGLQKMTPDIHALTLYRVDKQRFKR